MPLRILSLLISLGCFLALGVQAQEGKQAAKADTKADQVNVTGSQERLKQQFKDFTTDLLRLAQRLETSPKAEDRDKALALKNALKVASDQGIEMKFSTLIVALRTSDSFKNLETLQGVLTQNQEIREDLRKLIEVLLKDDREAQLRKERQEVQDLLEKLKGVIEKQERVQANTELGKLGKDAIAKAQDKVTKETKKLIDPKDGDPKDGKGKDSKGGDPMDGKSGDPMDSSPSSPSNPETQNARKKIQEGIQKQQEAEKKIAKDDKKGASENQADAVDKLKEAQKKLEDLLKQLREEELERLLAQLQSRCEKMLAMQIAVRDSTVNLDKAILSSPDKKATRADDQKALELSDREDDILKEATKALSLIESEGSAVAFAEVFKQVVGDMQTAAGRLRRADVGQVTVSIENDIIDSLKEMIEAFKKARKDNQQPKPPSPPMPGNPGQPPDNKLVDTIAELKMIRSMQIRVNNRTALYGKQLEGEQLPSPVKVADAKEREKFDSVRKEFKDLSGRQQKLSKVTEDIAKGRNKGQ